MGEPAPQIVTTGDSAFVTSKHTDAHLAMSEHFSAANDAIERGTAHGFVLCGRAIDD